MSSDTIIKVDFIPFRNIWNDPSEQKMWAQIDFIGLGKRFLKFANYESLIDCILQLGSVKSFALLSMLDIYHLLVQDDTLILKSFEEYKNQFNLPKDDVAWYDTIEEDYNLLLTLFNNDPKEAATKLTEVHNKYLNFQELVEF